MSEVDADESEDQGTDDETLGEKAGSAIEAATGAVHELWRAIKKAWEIPVTVVADLSRLTQIFLATISTFAFQQIVDSIAVPNISLPVLSSQQLIGALTGVVILQTIVQTRKLNHVHEEITNMDPPEVATDGGPDQEDKEVGTSGGGALGGAITGAALGASYGPQGVVAGALFGAIIGDELEERSSQPPDSGENEV